MPVDPGTTGFELTPEQERLIALLNRTEKLKPLASYYLGALYALAHPANPECLSQAGQSMRELFEKFPVASGIDIPKVDGTEFKNARNNIEASLDAARPEGGWQGEISNELRTALDLIEKYIAKNKGPDRQEQTAMGIAAANPFLGFSSEQIQAEIKDTFKRCGRAFQDFAHHNTSNRDKFLKMFGQAEIVLMAIINPPPSQALAGIREVVKLDPSSLPKAQLDGVFAHLSHKGENYDYFFRNVSRPFWVKELSARGLFTIPPGIETKPGGYSIPMWMPLAYLARVASQVPEEAVTICCALPTSDNPRIYMEITSIALAVEPSISVRLKDKLIEGANLSIQILGDGYGDALAHWASIDAGVNPALELADTLVRFLPDPNREEKLRSKRDGLMGFLDALEGRPKFDSWQYHRILTNGVGLLAKKAPLPVVRILANALMELQSFKHEDVDKALTEHQGEDFSDIWCRRVDAPSGEYVESDEALIHALTNACAEVCQLNDPEGAGVLNDLLNGYPWSIFRRVRHHLYGRFPHLFREQIRGVILGYQDHEEREYHREEAEAIRGGCDYFGRSLFEDGEFEQIVSAILAGPDRAAFQEWVGDKFSENLFAERRNYFHRQQFWPYESVLDGQFFSRFQEAVAAVSGEPSLDTYYPTPMEGAKTGGSRSPINVDELASKTDAELIAIINDWSGSQPDAAEWWITIDIEGLAAAFGGCIHRNPARFLAWTEQWKQIRRPIFMRAAIDAVGLLIDATHSELMPPALRLCDAILEKPVRIDVSPQELSAESDTQPAWDRARRGVAGFVEKCLYKDTALPAEWCEPIGGVIRELCIAPDPYLDRGTDDFGAGTDILNASINTTRGRGLRLLIDFNRWAQKFGSDSPAATGARELLRSTLDVRFSGGPLVTSGELALLALHFGALASFDPEWTRANLPNLFPRQTDPARWAAAFGYLVLHHNPYNLLFDILADEYRFAIENLAVLQGSLDENRQVASKVEALGAHLFFYFIWGRTPLTGNESLLEQFYAHSTKKQWAAVMRRTGKTIHRSVEIESNIMGRACQFVEHRLSIAEHTASEVRQVEMDGLTNWITAKVLDPIWRLGVLHRALRIGRYVSSAMPLVEALSDMFPHDPSLAVECFAAIADWATDSRFYIDPNHGKAILSAGAAHPNQSVRDFASLAKERLLGAGRYEYLD